jgi:hypothetical protein
MPLPCATESGTRGTRPSDPSAGRGRPGPAAAGALPRMDDPPGPSRGRRKGGARLCPDPGASRGCRRIGIGRPAPPGRGRRNVGTNLAGNGVAHRPAAVPRRQLGEALPRRQRAVSCSTVQGRLADDARGGVGTVRRVAEARRAAGRCGGMADARDLKLARRHFQRLPLLSREVHKTLDSIG